MTTTAECLPECGCLCPKHFEAHQRTDDCQGEPRFCAPGCPNAAPKASEAPVEECVEGCLCTCGDILAVHMVTRAPFEPDPHGHAIACPKYIDLFHPNGRCTCGGEGRCEWCERIGNSYADDWVNTKPAPAPVDVGPGSAWQRKAEENARRLASFSPEASEAPEQHGPDDVRLGRPTVCSSYCEYWLTWEHSEDCTPAPAPKASEAPKVDEPRCLPECERNCWSGQDKHAYGCPVAALLYLDLKEPAPAPEPKCRHDLLNCFECYPSTLDAPEPKQGSEEPPPLTTPATPGGPAIDWKRADKWAIEYEDDWAPGATPNAARAYLALRADLAAEKARADRAERENEELAVSYNELKAKYDRAEARVAELEQQIVAWRSAQAVKFLGDAGEHEAYQRRRDAEIILNEIADDLLAARARKEGGSR